MPLKSQGSQATFLALARNSGAVRDGDRLGPFLHGVAVRVGSNARRSATRRSRREHVAGRVGPGPAVPDSAWDTALAAVHAEAARLPEALRVPFVMCCLEGRGATEAADLLGWKLGTLSGRLTRAKQTLLARLEARGLSAGAVVAATAAGGATAGVPAGVVARAIEITRPGVAVAETVLSLSQGVVGMTVLRMKLVAAAVLVAGGLGTSVGSGWLATADAQTPTPAKPSEARPTSPPGNKISDTILGRDIAGPHSSKWEYRYETFSQAGGNARPLSGEFEQLLDKNEADGWQFVGQVDLRVGTKENWWGGPALVFRRPTKQAVADREARDTQMAKLLQQALQQTTDPAEMLQLSQKMRDVAGNDPTALAQLADMFRVIGERIPRPTPATATRAGESKRIEIDAEKAEWLKRQRTLTSEQLAVSSLTTQDDPVLIEAEIKRLQDRLAKIQSQWTFAMTFGHADLPFPSTEMADLLRRLAAKTLGDGRLGVHVTTDTNQLVVKGNKDAVEWAVGVVRRMNGK